MEKGRQSEAGICSIAVQGFKCLAKESRIEIRPLTILAGAFGDWTEDFGDVDLMAEGASSTRDVGHHVVMTTTILQEWRAIRSASSIRRVTRGLSMQSGRVRRADWRSAEIPRGPSARRRQLEHDA